MTQNFPNLLKRNLWHVTSRDRFLSMQSSGAILRCPPIADSERWATSQGREHWPLVRYLGGISLFNFNDFDPELYTQTYPMSSWRSFVPSCHRFTESIWIEIDKEAIIDSLLFEKDLKQRVAERNLWCHNRMPLIEIACLCDIDIDNFLNVFLHDTQVLDFVPYDG
ncbi:hypothetical protein [Desulfotalea psychrophila]|uniref:Uncharacterized protein n=1 Tax=Desulfotalea psychrophila (strain LSv54 / DSM 12343) TaxID=177439 RepID=Q6AR84_DESPS|nr:hypothetical protein [Desulfotalea psychrophila]CAG35140.1 unknown protein [Desulfotalea psychrophila LSv54]